MKMKLKKGIFLVLLVVIYEVVFSTTADEILKKVDKNLNFTTAVATIRLEIYLPNQPTRIKRLKSYIQGTQNSYVEFLNKEDKHIRYLKVDKKMWIYDKEEENTFLISGHLLKQGMAGSDISYEDAMESDVIYEKYNVELLAEDKYKDRECYLILLTAKVKEVSYFKRKMWVDKEYFVPLKEERYSKTDKLLKVFEYEEIELYKDRIYPKRTVVSDKLKKDTKTVVVIEEINFDIEIPKYYFTKRHLER